jgi:phosphatidylcholine synthase
MPAAFLVHVFTASGAACALLALLAAVQGQWTAMFAWLGLALVIDGLDGTFARRLRVAERLPRWSGEALDLVVDFTTYVFVPAFALVRGGLLPEAAAIPLGVAIVVSGALYFADTRMKTADNHFRGFPALWNGVAFHLFVLKLSPWIAAAVVAALVVATFLPLRVVHPLRVVRLRRLNIAVLALWSGLGLYALATALQPGMLAAWLLATLGVYILAAGLFTARD